MGTVYMLIQASSSKPYRVVIRKNNGEIKAVTGWCSTLAYPENKKKGMIDEGWKDGGEVTRGEGQDALFDIEEKDFSKTKNGYDFGEVTSAMQKEIRRGNEVEAGWWTRELAVSGYHKYVWRRLIIIAAEDVGTGSPEVHAQVESLRQSYFWYHEQTKGREMWNQFIAMAVLLMCRAGKNREVDSYTWYIDQEVEKMRLEIPDYALDTHTARGRAMGRAYRHFFDEAAQVYPEVGENRYDFIHDQWIEDQEQKGRYW